MGIERNKVVVETAKRFGGDLPEEPFWIEIGVRKWVAKKLDILRLCGICVCSEWFMDGRDVVV